MNLAAELAPRVRVNTVSPGGTRTPMTAEHVSRQLGIEKGRMLLGGLAEPADVAATIVHIALDATGMTGSVIPVDGGFTAR